MSKRNLCIFGEVLFDHFPDGKCVLGGAPFNVAWHLQALNQAPRFISRVGDDDEGRLIKKAMTDWGMRTDTLQIDPNLPTGQVSVSFIDDEPAYEIVNPCAYDAIVVDSEEFDCQLFYHGSLALRGTTSRQTARQIMANKPELVFVDVNLRSPWWEEEQVLEMVSAADWVKLNSDELNLLYSSANATTFLADYQLKGLVLTHGVDGAEILTADSKRIVVQPAKSISVVDTVGAGDAFTAVIILGLANDWSLNTTAQRAQDFASELVGHRGATVSDPAFYRSFINDWA